MPKIIVTQGFAYAHGGHRVERFEPAEQPVDTTDECAQLAVAEGWATVWGEPEDAQVNQAPPAGRADAKHEPAAPANKDAASKRSTKGAAA